MTAFLHDLAAHLRKRESDRLYEQWLFDSAMPVIPTFTLEDRHVKELPEDLTNTKAMSEFLLRRLRALPPVVNRPTGRSISFFRPGIESSLKSKSEIVRKLYLALPGMLRIAVPDGFEHNEKKGKKPGIDIYRIFRVRVADGNSSYLVRIKVDVPDLGEDGSPIRNDGYYYHGIESVEHVG